MKKLISEYGKLHDIKNDIVDSLKSDKKLCKYFYKLYLENIKESPVRSQNKWVQERGVEMDDRHTSILPLLGLQEILSFKSSVQTFPCH